MALPAPIGPGKIIPAIDVHRGSNRISNFLDATSTPGAAGILTVTETHETLGMVIPGGGSIFVNLPGISFYFPFLSAASGVDARPINAGQSRSFVHYQKGTGLRLGTTGFQKVEIKNSDPVNQIIANIVIGGGVPNNTYDEYIDKRVIITGGAGGSGSGNVFIQNGVTQNVAFKTRVPAWGDSLLAGATQAVTDGFNGLNRKSIIFANDDNVAILQVLDTAGNILGSVQPATSWTTDTGGTISIKNPSAGAVTCHIGEIYYS